MPCLILRFFLVRRRTVLHGIRNNLIKLWSKGVGRTLFDLKNIAANVDGNEDFYSLPPVNSVSIECSSM
jgi:hypothetical protein